MIQKAIESVEVTEYHQREWKATINFFLLFITVFNLPSMTVAVVVDRLSEVPAALFVIRAFTGVLVSAIIITDPIVIMRHRDSVKYLKLYGIRSVSISRETTSVYITFTDSFLVSPL